MYEGIKRKSWGETNMSLSDKEIPATLTDSSQPKYRKSDVKEFIDEIREFLENINHTRKQVLEKLDELAGEKLIK